MEPDCELHLPYKIDCPNMQEVETESWHYELYECKVCGARMKLYYDEMT